MLSYFKNRTVAFIGALILGLVLFEVTSYAANRIDIAPRRVILESRDRNGEFTLLNMGDQEGTFRVQIINYKQDEHGAYSKPGVPLNPAFNPEEVLRLSPRQFTLPAEGRQKVRFSIRKPADLPDGEYRFHIIASRLSDFGPPAPTDEGEKIVGLAANISTAIPIIVRHGQTRVSASLSDLGYVAANKEGKPEVKVTINREGNISTIGTITAYWTAQGSSQPVQIGLLSNMNVFTEISKRYVAIPLDAPLQGRGTLKVVYVNDITKAVYAETSIQQ